MPPLRLVPRIVPHHAAGFGKMPKRSLGLSFVVVVLEHHGAKLAIESKPLGGALFRVSFPLAED
jgi:K+-sensing histidine kinase KdpD